MVSGHCSTACQERNGRAAYFTVRRITSLIQFWIRFPCQRISYLRNSRRTDYKSPPTRSNPTTLRAPPTTPPPPLLPAAIPAPAGTTPTRLTLQHHLSRPLPRGPHQRHLPARPILHHPYILLTLCLGQESHEALFQQESSRARHDGPDLVLGELRCGGVVAGLGHPVECIGRIRVRGEDRDSCGRAHLAETSERCVELQQQRVRQGERTRVTRAQRYLVARCKKASLALPIHGGH